jgi:hypothetical protein
MDIPGGEICRVGFSVDFRVGPNARYWRCFFKD